MGSFSPFAPTWLRYAESIAAHASPPSAHTSAHPGPHAGAYAGPHAGSHAGSHACSRPSSRPSTRPSTRAGPYTSSHHWLPLDARRLGSARRGARRVGS